MGRSCTAFSIYTFCIAVHALVSLPHGCHGRLIRLQDLAAAYAGPLQQQDHSMGLFQSWPQHKQQHHLNEQLQGVLEHVQHITFSKGSSSSKGAGPAHTASASVAAPGAALQRQSQQPQRSLLGFTPSKDEHEAASKHAAKVSGWHVVGVTFLCLLSMGVLGFMGWKAMQWYERTKRPGYVELQALDNAFFKPTFTL